MRCNESNEERKDGCEHNPTKGFTINRKQMHLYLARKDVGTKYRCTDVRVP
jgi:hypothetical protein